MARVSSGRPRGPTEIPGDTPPSDLKPIVVKSKNRPKIADNVRARVYEHYKNRCASCHSKNNLTIHHRKPLSKGGSNKEANMILLCRRCHDIVDP